MKQVGQISVVLLALVAGLFAFLYTFESIAEQRVTWSRGVLLSGMASVSILIRLPGPDNRNRLQRFFVGTDTPINLSLARFVVFLLLWQQISQSGAVRWAAISVENWSPPWGWGIVPVEPFFLEQVVRLAAKTFSIVALMAAFGMFTIASVPLATVLALYLIGLGHFDGKVDHGHLLCNPSRLGVHRTVDRATFRRSQTQRLRVVQRSSIEFAVCNPGSDRLF